ncbi:MAG: ATP-dependent helicase HrpB [Cytophagales bacterium]|jgi:ATP-dependent helicase HrpB|nr:ATP-dependent helicase HrpB [Bacteroidota bacterium]MBS1980798.1 ATP-dependent helicase HrpB [Bacteroidota bacterium]WHZ08148.1 MAG: ATP-dependent helicase HrpB [Cytophagales bacterium]
MLNYPVTEILPQLRQKLVSGNTVILQAPPGAGKSTIVPLEVINEPWLSGKKIIMLQPRRLAARSVAARMAELLNEKLGETIGYRIRFEKVIGKNTRIEVVTEGILTRLLQNDNALEGVGLVIFDEFHERSLHADLALALCLQSQQLLRHDLRILLMSATLESEKISSLLGASVITSLGKQFPVELIYEQVEKNEPIAASVLKMIKRALREQHGDVLVFLPGVGEIKRTQEILESEKMNVEIFPLYGELSFQKQREAILPHPQRVRKIVLATSIAETSLTIEGIATVIDSGLSRVPKFDPRSGLTKLETVPLTQDAADQRAGRAGRLGPGVCYRLWAKAMHPFLPPARKPEILEADLAPMMLELFNWGTNVNDLKWVTPPPAGAVAQAVDLLTHLGAVENNKITPRGKEMVKLPTHPRIAHLLTSSKDKTLALSCDLAATLEERDPLPKETGADLSLRIELLRKWRTGERVNADKNNLERIEKIASSYRKIFNLKEDNSVFADTDAGKLVMEAYPERLAKQIEKFSTRYKLANGRVAKLQDHDPLIKNTWLAVASVDLGNNEGKIFSAAPVDETDLISLAKENENVRWDSGRGAIVASIEKQIGALTLSSKTIGKIDDAAKTIILCQAFRQEGLRLLNWSTQQEQWQARVLSLRKWRPDQHWPEVTDELLVKTCEEWLAPFLISVNNRSDFNRLDVDIILNSILPWGLQTQLSKFAPEKILVPSGSMINIDYSLAGEAPVLKVRLQEVFGWTETPTINEGKTKLILHLLSPGFKPVQVTQDLKNFWNTTYHDVRKELRMRYPKHHWPEDPWTAQAVRGAKRKG